MERDFRDMSAEERKEANAKVLQTAKAHREANEKLAKDGERKAAAAERFARQQEGETKKRRERDTSNRASGLDKIIASLVGTDFELTDEEAKALKG